MSPVADGRLTGGLDGKVAIVTGGAHGIGRATCAAFVGQGSRVVVADIDGPAGERAAQELRTAGGSAVFVRTDIAAEPSVIRMVEETVRSFGRLDVLVNNAAEFIMRGLEATVEEWRRILDVNVIGYATCSKVAAHEMMRVGKGAIVNVASVSSFVAQAGYLTYNTSKAAVANMTRCLALELAPHNIRVNAVCPGTVWTERTERHLALSGLSRAEAERHPEIGGLHMLRRVADPEEIAAAILFLASDSASFITAENLMVDGGYTAL